MSRATVTAPARRPSPALAVTGVLLWSGPVGIGLALAVLIASAPLFRHGPGAPAAGEERAWLAMWTALALVGLGSCAGLTANLVWLAHARHRGHPPNRREWFRVALNILLGAGFLWWWLAG